MKDSNSDKVKNCLYRVKNGKVENIYSHQLFTESIDIEGNYQLGEFLLNELTTKRCFKIKEKNFLILQCGELNILKNIQSNNNKVEFRLNEDKNLHVLFKQILKKTDVFLNPIHTPMGNQGKMAKRREFLSSDRKYYFSTSNTSKGSENLQANSLQYAYYNKKQIDALEIKCQDKFIRKVFEIK